VQKCAAVCCVYLTHAVSTEKQLQKRRTKAWFLLADRT